MTLTTAQQTEIAKTLIKPRGLLQVVHADATVRIATGGDVTWNSQTWLKSGFKMKSLKTGKGGIQAARIEILNDSFIWSELAILGKLNFKQISYWEYYGTNPALADPVLKFAGEVIKVPSVNPVITLDCATTGAVTKQIPFIALGAPDVNHMPYNGQEVRIGNDIYIVEVK